MGQKSLFLFKRGGIFFLKYIGISGFFESRAAEIIFLCTPANPTGAMIRQADLSKILDYCKKHGILLVLDECFVEFLDEERSCGCIREFLEWETGRPEHGGNLFLLRAFTKTYAMAGLRLGYGFCTSRELLERMEENWQPWSVSIPRRKRDMRHFRKNGFLF